MIFLPFCSHRYESRKRCSVFVVVFIFLYSKWRPLLTHCEYSVRISIETEEQTEMFVKLFSHPKTTDKRKASVKRLGVVWVLFCSYSTKVISPVSHPKFQDIHPINNLLWSIVSLSLSLSRNAHLNVYTLSQPMHCYVCFAWELFAEENENTWLANCFVFSFNHST